MPEVSGRVAHYVDHEYEAPIAEGILTVLRDEDYRQELSRRGIEKARLFSWEKAARETIDVYNQVLNLVD